MKVINLPDDIFPGNKMLMDPILIHHYSATVGSMNGRSVLNKNAISLVLKGEKTMHFSQKVVKIKDDEFHFLSAGNCLASIDLSGQDVFTSILIFFDTKVLADFHVKYNEQISRIRKRIKIVQESYISFKKDSFVLNLITSLQLSTEGGKQMSLQMRLLKFEELMLHLLEKYPETILSFQIPEKDGNDDLTLRKVVETNVLNPISIEELAFLCNLSLSTFKRRFIKLYGTTPSKWLVGRRMEFAANLLQHHHAKPSEVFFKVGYENHSSFTHSFKQSFGLTPKEFQAKIERSGTFVESNALIPTIRLMVVLLKNKSIMSTSIQEKKEIVIRFNKEVIEKGSMSSFNQLVSEKVINHSAPPGTPQGPESMIYFLFHMLRAGFPDLKVEILDQVAEGDLVTTRKKIHATHLGEFFGIAPTRKPVVIDIIDIIRIKDGKYAEHWGISNISDVVAELAK